jgi:hypothetical protein
MEGITKHGNVKRSIEILERDKEQTLKTLWGEEKLHDFFPRQDLVEEMHKLHEEHRETKRKAREDSDMGDAGETDEEEKEFSEEGAIWARKLDGAAIDKENKILYVLEFKRTTGTDHVSTLPTLKRAKLCTASLRIIPRHLWHVGGAQVGSPG